MISLLSVALLHAASAPPRSATFGLTLLGGVGAFSFNKIHAMHTRFPALHDVVVDVNDYMSVVPGLQLLLPQLAGFTSITELNVSNQGLVSFPNSLCALTGLTELNAWSNKLTTLPDSIAALTQMKRLHLSGNKFATFPQPIVKLTSLTVLHLGSNQLVTLPDSIAALTALKTLYLYNNPLAKPQSSAVEAWLAALEAGGCEVKMPEDQDGE